MARDLSFSEIRDAASTEERYSRGTQSKETRTPANQAS
jgi:hypothetical protein